mmetsp:Transcript_46648/g.117309  ORF Transcript_46648/g.117309 Transcript_46648/m.117309 type:complete len:233 (-) Transcript_46648:576-1274(-)
MAPTKRPKAETPWRAAMTLLLKCGPPSACVSHVCMAPSLKSGCTALIMNRKRAVFARRGVMQRSEKYVLVASIAPHIKMTRQRTKTLSMRICSTASMIAIADMHAARVTTCLCLSKTEKSTRLCSGGSLSSGNQRSTDATKMQRGHTATTSSVHFGPAAGSSVAETAAVAIIPSGTEPQIKLCRSLARSGTSLDSFAAEASIITSGVATEKFMRMKQGTVAAAASVSDPTQI